jgi:hypothetical protein
MHDDPGHQAVGDGAHPQPAATPGTAIAQQVNMAVELAQKRARHTRKIAASRPGVDEKITLSAKIAKIRAVIILH